MHEGGWRAFREASKARTRDEEAGAADAGTPGAAPETPPEETPPEETPTDTAADADIAAWNSKDSTPFPERAGIEDKLVVHETRADRLRGMGARLLAKIGHWHVLAIVPVAAIVSLMAVRAGLNPYALCLEWWDLLFGSIFFAACLTFLVFAIFRGPSGRWHPGMPALIVAVCVVPFWVGSNAAFHKACEEIPVTPALLPPLPPPVDVPTVPSIWPAPLPQPRPPGLSGRRL